MNFKSEKGFTGVDITVALIVILLFMSLIAVLFFNITKSSKSIDRKSEATYIATSVIEGFKSMEYDDIPITGQEDDDAWENVINSIENEERFISYNGVKITDTIQIKDGYTCKVKVYNHVPDNIKETGENAQNNDLVKVIKVRVEYKIGNEIESVNLTTSIVRDL